MPEGTSTKDRPRAKAEPPPERVPALVIAWSREERRVGETFLVTRRSVLGRGSADSDDPAPRVSPIEQRPGEARARPPLAISALSRVQLELEPLQNGKLRVRNVGRRVLFDARDRETKELEAVPGDVLEIDGELVLLVCERPKIWRRARPEADLVAPPFGEADAIGLVGESEAAWQLRSDIAFVAKRSANVLVLGPSGAGKELVAQGIHELSARRNRKLVARNAATMPAALVDAELFGNAASYPNHGMPERVGLVGEADGSTLFLDEIGELPEALQTHLLRLLDAGDYQRLGDAKRRTASCRFVFATNRPIESLREDIAARLKVRLTLPGLNERREDVPLLVRHLLRRIAKDDREVASRFFEGGDAETGEPRITARFIKALVCKRFTTHVREIEGMLWQAITASDQGEIDLPQVPREELERNAALVSVESLSADDVREALIRVGGVRERAWRELGLANRHVLKRLVKKFGLESVAGPPTEED